jgi:CYTH domain-containing protein
VPMHRQFIIAPSLARLIEREKGGERVRQGYFPDRPDRGTHVQVEGETGHLILVTNGPHGAAEEAADISRPQAEALLDLAAGRIEYSSVSLNIGSRTAAIHRFLTPGPLDLITVRFEPSKQAREFQPLAWFGPEVTGDPAYQARSVALAGLPPAPEVEITNAALDSLLDTLHGRLEAHQPQVAAPQPAPLAPAEAQADADDEQDQDDLNIQDSVIRDLARSLSPRRR